MTREMRDMLVDQLDAAKTPDEAARLRQRENATTTNEVTVTVKAGQN